MAIPENIKASYLFDGMTGNILPEEMVKTIRSFIATENLYSSATREIATKLENLNRRKRDSVLKELKAFANEIADIDKRMQNLYNISINQDGFSDH